MVTYLRRHNLHNVLEDMLKELHSVKPDDPYLWIARYFSERGREELANVHVSGFGHLEELLTIAKVGGGSNQEKSWVEHHDESGRKFWHNSATNEKTWSNPETEWEEVTAKDGRKFWYNSKTKEKTWNRPKSLSASKGDEKPHSVPPTTPRASRVQDWKEYTTKDGKKFWANSATGEKSWNEPAALKETSRDAVETPPAAGNSKWKAFRTPNGETFWYNTATSEKTWVRPPGAPEDEEVGDKDDDPANWHMVESRDGRTFWHNKKSGKTTWVKPASVKEKPAPSEWEEYKAPNGMPFWYNPKTKQKTWTNPNTEASSQPPAQPPAEWVKYSDKNGKDWWWNQHTGAKQWDPPDVTGQGADPPPPGAWEGAGRGLAAAMLAGVVATTTMAQ